ncbi:hypothetical protein NPIL_210201 [Nephila pilipes]|uniref:Uncharacterized protein n=1 Tax=Nephila pilipes TaxID=299642 RepID=A0A8X6PDI5_NEPPI|nr:hypothetical protein NPIL_210201 [Nephila pilipes]
MNESRHLSRRILFPNTTKRQTIPTQNFYSSHPQSFDRRLRNPPFKRHSSSNLSFPKRFYWHWTVIGPVPMGARPLRWGAPGQKGKCLHPCFDSSRSFLFGPWGVVIIIMEDIDKWDWEEEASKCLIEDKEVIVLS